MSRRNRRKLLVPEARAALDALKSDVVSDQTTSSLKPTETPAQQMANTLEIPFHAKDNGDMSARDAGKIGGHMGGPMVQRLIALAQLELARGEGTDGSAEDKNTK